MNLRTFGDHRRVTASDKICEVISANMQLSRAMTVQLHLTTGNKTASMHNGFFECYIIWSYGDSLLETSQQKNAINKLVDHFQPINCALKMWVKVCTNKQLAGSRACPGFPREHLPRWLGRWRWCLTNFHPKLGGFKAEKNVVPKEFETKNAKKEEQIAKWDL